MKFLMKAVIVCSLSLGTVAFAEATDPNVIARQDVMKTLGKNAKILGDMAGGKTAFDAAGAEAAKAALVAAAAEIPAKFETEAMDDDSKAKPEIWTNWDDFVAKGNALATAAGAIDTASIESIGAGMGGVGGACGACHKAYRAEN
jgi:cytochrome c556